MISKKLLVSLGAVLALAIALVANVSAATLGDITDLEVNGVDVLGATKPVVVFAGEKIPVRIEFESDIDAKDVRVKAWITGERELTSTSARFDAIKGGTYSRSILVEIPTDLDELSESLGLNVVVENRNDGILDEEEVPLLLERESYVVEVLDANMASQINAGSNLAIDIVLKNQGRYFADNTFVKVSIPALGIENRAFFGDIASIDEPFSRDPFEAENSALGFGRLDEQDTAERIVSLRIPSDAQPGTYVVEITAYNSDSETTITKKVAIIGAEATSGVLAPVHSKTFKVGETGQYDLVLVNNGNKLQVFELVIEPSSGLKVDVSEPAVAIPAGSSKTVKLQASAEKAGPYNFAVNVHSGTELVSKESFSATVEGSKEIVSGSPAVLLTVVLAVVFVVLLIVLIVLLTRRPEKTEETGESYY